MNNHVTHVNSLEEALILVEKLKSEGKYDLFRGQALDWDLSSTFQRLNNKDKIKAEERLELFYTYACDNKILKQHLNSVDSIIAIMQHYGFPTNYIDFTYNPSVAFYFATNSDFNAVGKNACIICVNRKDFDDFIIFVKSHLNKYLKEGEPRPQFIDLHVKNLWRLQAQQGCFLYNPFSGFEKQYKFDRILFPFESKFEVMLEEDIYPKKKSILEITIDQYLEAERRHSNWERAIAFFGKKNIKHIAAEKMEDYFTRLPRKHSSWFGSNIKNWKIDIDEHWEKVKCNDIFKVDITLKDLRDLHVEELTQKIEDGLTYNAFFSRDKSFGFEVNRMKIPFNKKVKYNVELGCQFIWNGMRSLPYSINQIAKSLARFIFMEYYKQNGILNDFNPLINDGILVEMSYGDGTNSRSYLCGDKIIKVHRKEIYKYFQKEYKEDTFNNPVMLVQLVYKPQYLFKFNDLCDIFSEDIIPYQVCRNLHSNNPLIYFNPYYLKTLGLA